MRARTCTPRLALARYRNHPRPCGRTQFHGCGSLNIRRLRRASTHIEREREDDETNLSQRSAAKVTLGRRAGAWKYRNDFPHIAYVCFNRN